MAALLLVIWAIVLPARAQTYEYSFTSNMGTYTPIDGGILLGTETSDDQRFVDPATPAGGTVTTGPGFDIGFNFTFNGASFDRLAINNNGWISLGQSALTPSVNNASTSGYTPISSVVAIDPAVLYNRIAGFARDIQAQAGASLRLQTIGTAPNRICVVQWANYKKYGTSGTGDVLNFQIRLYETTNNVQIVYGAMTCNTTAGNMQVGLRGPLATDFFSRTSATGWDNTTASTAYDQYVVLTDQYFPANGLTYSFNFPVATQPPNPAVLISPSDLATLVSPTATLNWISGGGLPTGFRLSFGTNNPPTNIVNNVDMGSVTSYNPNPDMQLSTTYYWKVVPYNNIGSAVNCPVWSFTTHGDPTVSTLPYSQNWDNVTVPALPFDWTAISQGTVTTSYVKTVTTSPHTTPNCVALYNSSDATGNYILVGPQVMPPLNVNSIRVKFWGKGGAAYHLLVGVMTNPSDPATFTTVQDVNVIANWNEYAVGLTGYAGTGRYIAFKHANASSSQTLYVDEVSFEQIAANDLACTGLSGNTTPSVNSPITYTATVFNWGTASQSTYTVKLYNSTGTELASVAGTTVAPGATATVSINWTPTAEGPATLYARVILTGDVNPANDQSPNLAITVMPSGTYVVTVGDGTANIRMPLDFFYKNSINETLYFPTELGMYGNVSSITLYNNFPAALDNMPVKIWMGSTTLSDLSAGWIPSGELTSVFDGTVSFPMGENSITIPLQTAYSYSSGNLVVMFHRPMDTQYYSSSDYFKGQTVGTNRARNVYNDTTVYDPAAPGTVGTVTGQFAKTTFHMTPLSPNPLFSVSPASKDFGTVLLNTTNNQVFTVMNVGGGTLSVSNISIAGSPFYTFQNMPTLPASLGTGQSITFTARYLPTAAGTHIATISITDNRMVHTVALTGTCMDPTITTLPYIQAFDGVTPPALPIDWSSIYQATVTTGYVKTVTTSPHSTPNCVAIYNPTDVNTIAMLIAPPLANSILTNTTRVKFWGKGGTNYTIKVGVMTNPSDPATFTEVQSIVMPSTWTQYVVSLAGYTGTGKYVAFRHGNFAATQTLYVDDVEIELIAANDLACTSLTGNSTPSVGNATTYTASIYNWGYNTQNTYTVKLYNGTGTELASAAGISVAPDATVSVPLNWTPTVEGPTTLYAKVILAGDQNATNDQSPNLAITVMPQGLITVTVGDGSQTIRMPLDFFYKNSLNETLYFPTELGMYGNITAIALYNNFPTSLSNLPVKIWMGSTQLTDLSAGWIPSTELTLVYDGTMSYPAGENTITFPLQTVYPYTNGNLVVLFNRPMDTQYYSSSDYFKGQTVGTNRARNIYSDSTVYDPAAPGTVGTVTGQFAKTTFHITPMGTDPIFAINPASKDFGTVLMNTTQNQAFTVMNVGGGTLTVNTINIAGSPFFSLQNMPTLPLNLTTGQSATFTARYNPTAAGAHTATITLTDNRGNRSEVTFGNSRSNRDRMPHTVALSANCIDTTINALPYTQNFDAVTAPALPVDWSRIVQATVTSAYVQTYTTTPNSAPNCAGLANSTDANATLLLVAPPVGNAFPMNTLRLKFMYRTATAGYPLSVGVMTDPLNAATFTELASITNTVTTWTQQVVSLTGYTGTGRYLAFKHGLGGTSRILYVDDVVIEVTPQNDLAATALSGNATPTVGAPAQYNVSVYNWGTNAQNTYNVKLYNSSNTELATATGTAVQPGATVVVPVTWTPQTAGAMTLYAKVVLTGDQNATNDQSPNLNVLVNPSGVFTITVGDGSQQARVPVDMYWKNSLFETLYYPAELGNFMGQITGLTFYNNFVTTTLTAKPTKVWIGTTTQADLSGGWIPSTNLTLVFDGTIDYPGGQNNITIPFNTPYMYLNGQNLVLLVNRPMDTDYFSSSDNFYAQTVGTNRALKLQSDSTTYDPANPPATGATLSGQFPKTTFLVIPGGVGHVQGTVLGAGNQPLEGVAVQITDTNYSATTNASGQYTIQNVLPNTYNIQFSKYGYVTQTQAFTLLEDETETINVTLVPMATVNVTGTVLGSDTGAGLSGAAIHLDGYADYDANSNATGAFTIPSVYANQTYAYTIICAGYTTRTGTVNVGATNHNMGNMILNEVAYSPLGVTAAANDLNTQVALTWLAPDPNALEITESFEAETFPPTEWARTITNTGPANTLGIFPSWCRFGAVTISGQAANPTNGSYQAGLYWDYAHQDEWLITPGFNCPPSAYLRFDGYVFLGSENADHYYVKASIDNGVNWTVLWDASAMTGGWNYYASPITVDLSTYGGQQLKLAFHATDGPNDDGLWYVWFIDNIYIGNAITNIRFTTEELTSRSANPNGASFSGSVPTRAASRRMEEGGNRTEPRLPFINEVRHNADVPRVLTGYKVWRLAAGQETNEPSWTSLTPQAITALNLTDSGWQTLPNGDYRWAVKAIYTADVASAPALSNVLTKQTVTGMIAGVVRRQNTTPISGATITAGGFTATTNTAGAYSMVVPVGTYSVTASATGFVSNTVENVTVVQNLTTTVNFVLTPGSPNDDPNAPVNATVLRGNYPNPFNPETTIAYSVKEPGPVWIGIYNVKGQLIRTLVNDVRATGHYTVVFDGRDDNGRSVSSGVYFMKMNAGDYHSTRKMIMMQ